MEHLAPLTLTPAAYHVLETGLLAKVAGAAASLTVLVIVGTFGATYVATAAASPGTGNLALFASISLRSLRRVFFH